MHHPNANHSNNNIEAVAFEANGTQTGFLKDITRADGSKENVKTYTLYQARWLVLLAVCLVNMAYNALWITFSSISDIAVMYYTIEPLVVDWLSMSFLLTFMLFALPAAGFLSTYGLRATILVAAILNTCGTFTRSMGIQRDGFVYIVAGQLMIAVSGPFIAAVPPELATTWFGEHERAIATSIGVLMSYVGVAVGFLQPTFIVPDSKDLNRVLEGIDYLVRSQAIFCSLSLVLVVLLVKDKPATPPSLSQELRGKKLDNTDVSFFTSIRLLAKDLDFNLTAQAYGIMFGLLTVISTLLNQLVKANLKTLPDSQIGLMGFVATIIGIVGILVFGFWIEAYQLYKFTATFVYVVGTICLVCFSASIQWAKSYEFIFVSFCVFNLVAVPYTSFGLEQIAEITYPLSEFTTCTLAMMTGNMYGLVLTYIFGWMVEIDMLKPVNGGCIALSVLGLILVLIAKVPMKRTEMDHAKEQSTPFINKFSYESTLEKVI